MKVLETRRSDRGVGVFASEHQNPEERARALEQYLAEQTEDILAARPTAGAPCPIIVSGMASSSIGWHELPYARVPFDLDGAQAVTRAVTIRTTSQGAVPVTLVSGLRTSEDIMRGEETQIVGLLADPELSGHRGSSTVILPGTHSKHVTIGSGKVLDFHTYMTGELFNVIRNHSVLRHSTLEKPSVSTAASGTQSAFVRGVQDARSGGLAGALFRIRARDVLNDVNPGQNTGYLSGLVIGSELNELRDAAEGSPILLCADQRLQASYHLALQTLGLGSLAVVVPASRVLQATIRGQATLLDIGETA